jgi:hypothetical protein
MILLVTLLAEPLHASSVHFHGRVIDQFGQGVANARVHMVVSGHWLSHSTGRTFFRTDANGHFKVKAKGHNVSILDVQHPKVADVFFRNHSDGRKEGARPLWASDQWGRENNWRSYEEKEQPLIIHVWRAVTFEKVKRRPGAYHIPLTGERMLFDNSLKVTCNRAAPDNLSQSQYHEYIGKYGYGDWSVTLAPVKGGIQETEDLYLNEAPESGYAPKIKVSMNKSDADYAHQVYPKRHYYYHAKDGKVFGSLEIAFEPYAKKDKCVLITKAKYNPNGSRNLAIQTD